MTEQQKLVLREAVEQSIANKSLPAGKKILINSLLEKGSIAPALFLGAMFIAQVNDKITVDETYQFVLDFILEQTEEAANDDI